MTDLTLHSKLWNYLNCPWEVGIRSTQFYLLRCTVLVSVTIGRYTSLKRAGAIHGTSVLQHPSVEAFKRDWPKSFATAMASKLLLAVVLHENGVGDGFVEGR